MWKKECFKQVNQCNVAKQDDKIYKSVNINGNKILILLDTDSDLHLLKTKQYIKLGLPSFSGPSIICPGLGVESITTLGSFMANVKIDEDEFELNIHVISDIIIIYCWVQICCRLPKFI